MKRRVFAIEEPIHLKSKIMRHGTIFENFSIKQVYNSKRKPKSLEKICSGKLKIFFVYGDITSRQKELYYSYDSLNSEKLKNIFDAAQITTPDKSHYTYYSFDKDSKPVSTSILSMYSL